MSTPNCKGGIAVKRLLSIARAYFCVQKVDAQILTCLCRYIDSRAENGVTALHLAAIQGFLPCVMVLLGAGASMMVRTVDLDMHSALSIPSGSTPLHLAAQKGQVAIIQAMLQVSYHSWKPFYY